MCGIAGFIDPAKALDDFEGEAILSRMLTRIKHRGPDGCGLFLEPGVGLGSVRLSIIDLSGGDQPISNEDDTLWIVYNGEIFNYLELRDELLIKGHKFKTHTDTEVILHLYEEYGKECLQYLNGQFAFAIWDRRDEACFFARDRIGIRPFFYTFVKGSIVFGSEIKSLFEFPDVKRTFSPHAIKEVFTFWTTLTPNTIFDKINELPPGHFAVFKNGHLGVSRYWSLRYSSFSDNFSGTIGEAAEQLGYLLKDSLRLQLRSDVQVGAYLSGGLDSSTITSLIKKYDSGILNTFSIGFSDNVYDETKYQLEVAKYLETRHKCISSTASDIAGSFPEVIWHTEMPLLRTAPAPMMELSKFVHENGFKVVITGEGADEALAGYDIFKEAIIRQFWAQQPGSKIRPLLLKKLYPYIPSIANAGNQMLLMFFKYKLEDTDSPVYSHLLRWHNTSNIQKHFSDEILERAGDYDPVEYYSEGIRAELDGISSLAKAQLIETNIFMSGYLLSSQGDRVAMANSVEGRYPFLDHRLMEFAASLPDHFKLKGMSEKYILKELMRGELPQMVLNRPKQAYRSPVLESFIGSRVPDYVHEMLSVEELKNCGIFNPESVYSLLRKLRLSANPSEVDQMAFIGILSTQLVFNLFIKKFRPLGEKEILTAKKVMRLEKLSRY